jgi:type III pantothenate kinase
MPVSDFLAIAVGNSNLRWCVFRGGSATSASVLPVEEPVPSAVRESCARVPVYVASVNPVRTAHLRIELACPFAVLGKTVPIPIRNATRAPDQVGADRLLTALGAWHRAGPAVVVDVGTAITVNLVAEGPTFRGGAILPGPVLWARALHQETALLPEVVVRADPPPAYGADTEEAVAAGIYWGVAGAVRLLIRKIEAENPGCAVCLTGGGAPLLRPQLEDRVRDEPDLIFEGIRLSVAALG